MKNYTDKELEKNYHNFIEAITRSFTGERLEKLLHMYSVEELGGNLMLSPASGNKSFHNAYDGGYIDHVMNVVRNSIKMMKLYAEVGGVVDFTQEELLFSAFHHDLGKLGEKNELHYLKNDSDWHVKNQGKIYKVNTKIPWMTFSDRTFFLLNKYGVEYSTNEFFGMKLTDGMYDDEAITYLKSFNPEQRPPTNIQHILHWADHMSTVIERDENLKK